MVVARKPKPFIRAVADVDVGLSAQVRALTARAQRAGFVVTRSDPAGRLAAVRRPPHRHRGLQGFLRDPDGEWWALFAGWPIRRCTMAELRALCDDLGGA